MATSHEEEGSDPKDRRKPELVVRVGDLDPMHADTDLALALGKLAGQFEFRSRANPDDALTAEMATILRAYANMYRDAGALERGDAPAKPEIASRQKEARERLTRASGQAEVYLRKHNQGPRQRWSEVEILCRAIEGRLAEGYSDREVAEHAIQKLHILPILAGKTSIQAVGAWPVEQREAAIAAVELAIHKTRGKDAEAVTKAALRALDYPASKAKNVFEHRNRYPDEKF